jgi:hypothetical protein
MLNYTHAVRQFACADNPSLDFHYKFLLTLEELGSSFYVTTRNYNSRGSTLFINLTGIIPEV